MSSIDERIVYMKFDNTQFEAGIKTTLTSLSNLKKDMNFDDTVRNLGNLDKAGRNVKFDTSGFTEGTKNLADQSAKIQREVGPLQQKINDLKKTGADLKLKFDATAFGSGVNVAVGKIADLKGSINFDKAIESIGNLSLAGRNFNLDGMAKGVDTIAAKFQNLSVVGIAAIATLTAKAVDAGVQMANKLFIENPKAGLEEYETNLNSIQTILANTSHQGTNLEQVNAALDNLNEYSDKTIYNFAEMAKNIGTFTAAGVDLDTSTQAIKGIANIAALSGSNSQQAATAMQQLSQELAAGKIGLEGWNSVVNAGMGGKVFQDALIETARVQGKNVDAMIKKQGSFRNSLQEGWLDSAVMTQTLSQFTGDLNDEQLRGAGYTEEQIANIQKMAKTAQEAATVIKTGTALTGTLAESTGSGWAQTWKIVIGDFEEAKKLWTGVYAVLGKMVNDSADRRNALLQGWKDLGGRDVAIEALSNAFKILMGIVTPIGKAFREVFPAMTAQRLYDITVKIRDFTAALIPGEKATSVLYNTFKFLFSVLKVGIDIITGVFKVLFAFVGALFKIGQGVATAGDGFGSFFTKLIDSISKFDVAKFFDRVATAITKMGDALYWVTGTGMHYISKFARYLFGLGQEGAEVGLTRIRERLESLGEFGKVLMQIWDRVKQTGERIWAAMKPLRDAVKQMFIDIGQNIKEVFTDVNFDQALDLVNTGLFAGLILLFRNFFKKTLGMGDGLKENLMEKIGDTFGGIVDALDGVTGVLKAMQTNLQADTLVKIAIAIGVLTASVVILSLIDSDKLTSALVAMTVMFTQLGIAMKIFEVVATGPGVLKLPVLAAGFILLAIAIGLLAGAVKRLSRMEWPELIKGLVGVLALLGGIAAATKLMGPTQISGMVGAGIGMIAIAVAIKILASAVKDLSGMSWADMIQGLIGVGAMLAGIAIFSQYAQANKGAIASGIGLILLATAIKVMASALQDFAGMNMGGLVQGLVTLGIVMSLMSKFTQLTANLKGIFTAAVAMVVLGAAMKVMASAVADFGSMNWDTLAKGLLGFVIALGAVTLAMMLMPPNMVASAVALIVVGAALKIIASALKDFGGMSWEELAKGLILLAGSLVIIAAATIAMTAALPGAAAIFVVAAALAILAPVLQTLGNFSWEQLGMAMAGLAATFLVFGLAGLLLAPLTPVLIALGAAMALIGVGMFLTGVGTLAFVAALILLATVGSATIPIIVGLVTQILGLIPTALRLIGEGIVEFAKVLGNNVPVFVEAMVKLLMGLLEAINTVAGPIVDTLMKLIDMLLKALLDNVPNFLVMGLKLIVALLQGIADNIDDVVIAALNIVVALLNGIADRLPAIIDAGANLIVAFLNGIGNSTQKIVEAGINMIINVVNGVADGIRNNTERMNAAGRNLAGAIIDGMTSGIRGGIDAVVNAAKGVADSAVNAAKNLLGIKSPSRVFRHEIGEQIPAGMALGIRAKGYMVTKATEQVGDTAINAMKRSMANLSSVMLSGDMNMDPVIRPVLDLSSVKKDAGALGGMLKSPTLTVSGNYARATSLLEREQANRAAANASLDVSGGSGSDQPPMLVFEQNNYSPKALSTTELYRNTNNQLSNAKGILLKHAD